jgi:hypothetical protein
MYKLAERDICRSVGSGRRGVRSNVSIAILSNTPQKLNALNRSNKDKQTELYCPKTPSSGPTSGVCSRMAPISKPRTM